MSPSIMVSPNASKEMHLVLSGLLVDISLGVVLRLVDLVSKSVLGGRGTGGEGGIGVLGDA